ncbi:MAG TPA: S53 family serine peptidase, partial [Candidatus Dormibacteraeota bacterium]|nr:S53 family serine peptidase [Candidatus Dormibacteraeota bacterium]
MARSLRFALVAVVVPLATFLVAPASQAAQAQPRVGLHASATPGLASAQWQGSVAPDQAMSIAVSLQLRNVGDLKHFIDQVSDRSSPMAGQYLTPQQFTDRYGPTVASVQQVSDFLVSQGLTVNAVSPNRTVIDASGSAASMQRAFGTTISRWHDNAQGRDFFANDSDPTVPAGIASLVVGIAGLNNHYPRQHHATCPSGGMGPVAGAYCPAQVKTAYNVNALSLTGTGQAVGLFELDGFVQTNLNMFHNEYYGTNSPVLTPMLVDNGPVPPLGGGQLEVELDIEVVQAYAPGAAITVFEGPNSDTGVIDTYNQMVSSNLSSNSTSWGQCEPKTTPSTVAAEDNIFMQAAAQGMSFFAASGDFGRYDCNNDPTNLTDTRLSVDNPADDPFVTGVGGTSLVTNLDFTYASESAWGNTARHLAGGGGLSTIFARPSWQNGPGVTNASSNGMREVPDVASHADNSIGYSIYSNNAWREIGGTSAGAPAWAAFTALFNQDAAASGKPRLGFANPSLYSLACSPPPPFAAFHDVTTGNNAISTSAPFDLSFSATPGWDYATGLGSFDANNLARDLLSPSSAACKGTAPLGYWMVASDGGIFPFGSAPGFGSTGGIHLNQPIVGMARTPDGGGYWLVASDGGIFPFGDAVGYGSTGNIHLNQPIVGIAAVPHGRGYYMVASDGGIFPFGPDAVGYGSTGNIRLNQPIVGMTVTPDGGGYWLVASDGGIFPFGDAPGYGSTGGIRLNQPIVGMAANPQGGGYWMVASDGGIFPFGPDAVGYGSTGNIRLNQPIVGMTVTPDGGGYWLVA